VNWDENYYVRDNPLIRSLSLPSVVKMITTAHYGLYKPVVLLSFALEYHFFKLNPFTYHLTNLILHLANSLLAFVFIYIFSKDALIAFIVGLLFGIHPLHVESVAWIAERKDMLYGFFILGASIFYLSYIKKNKIIYFYLSLLSFILSLLAKPMGILFPFLVLLFDYCSSVKYNKASLVTRGSFFAVAVIFSVCSFYNARHYFTGHSAIEFINNIGFASCGLIFYIYKFFLPLGLSSFYPYPRQVCAYIPAIALLSAMSMVLITVAAFKNNKKIMFGAGLFFLNILPGLQIVRMAPHLVADRYIYIALTGLAYLLALAIKFIYSRARRLAGRIVFYAFVVLIILTLSFLTRQRCGVWKNGFTLWQDAIRHTPDNAFAYNNLGVAYSNIKNNQEAVLMYQKAMGILPNWWVPHKNLCGAYVAMGKNEQAVEECSAAVRLGPPEHKLLPGEDQAIQLSSLYRNLACAYDALGRKQKAINAYERVAEFDPDDIESLNNLAVLYAQERNTGQAIDLWNKIVNIDPNFATAHFNLSVFYFQQGKYDLAIKHCDKVTALGNKVDPEFIKLLKPYRK
jgi:protein O-mannosyl-transferase